MLGVLFAYLSDEFIMTKTIGETNGVWGYLFKFTLVMMPPALVWMGWMTVNQVLDNSFRAMGPRVNPEQVDSKVELIVSRLEPRLVRIETQLENQNQVRPADVNNTVELLGQKIERKLDELESQIKGLPK